MKTRCSFLPGGTSTPFVRPTTQGGYKSFLQDSPPFTSYLFCYNRVKLVLVWVWLVDQVGKMKPRSLCFVPWLCPSHAGDAGSGETVFPSHGGPHSSDALHHQQGIYVGTGHGGTNATGAVDLLSVHVIWGSVVTGNTWISGLSGK